MHKLRVIPWLIGIVLIVGTLAGANKLLHPTDTSAGGAAPLPAAPKPAPPSGSESLIAKGTIHSDPPTVAYTLPAHLQAAQVLEVKVQAGDKVNVDDVLIVFDTALMQKEAETAKHKYGTAVQEYQMAMNAKKQLEVTKKLAALAVKDASEKQKAAQEAYDLAKRSLEKQLETLKNGDGSPLSPQQMEERRRDDIPLMQTHHKLNEAINLLSEKQLDEEKIPIEADRLQHQIDQAALKANAIKEELEKIERAIQDSTLRAKAAGVVEQVTAAKGQTVYPQTQPLLYLVPTGKRVVWAEIVPDFSHRIKDRDGQKVTITDDSNTHLTYEGVVHRTRSAFLPKPNGAPDILNGKPNVVLIVEVEVVDASPAGKPPLRVGQPVRVIFP